MSETMTDFQTVANLPVGTRIKFRDVRDNKVKEAVKGTLYDGEDAWVLEGTAYRNRALAQTIGFIPFEVVE